ncbi:Ribokinase [Hyphodiscus hymeniophilus]|uniref:Ribokinase n=1 Tax=Hyphodiscus hymeniophilus TaxID=353542 RepID=A0A9P6VEL8_9HELO|nr:Ribokinase [Hyphodiscus hymeniophilus]
MIGAVGSDEFGPSLIQGLQRDGIDTSRIREVSGQTTGVAVIIVEESTGENRILFNPGANHFLQPSHFKSPSDLGDPLPDLIIMQLEISMATVLQILKTAEAAGVHILLNPAPAVEIPDDAYTAITHLIVNESEAAILTGRKTVDVEADDFDWAVVAKEFLKRGVKNIVVTLGSKGAFFASAEQPEGVYVRAEKVKRVVDTTAAGDTFVGAYAVSVVRKGGKGAVGEEDVKRACRAAGKTVEKTGAQSAIPWADEVDC